MTSLQDRQFRERAGEQSMQEEDAMEESMDFAMLHSTSTIKPMINSTKKDLQKSAEETAMWDNYGISNELHDVGVDSTAASMEERKRLEREANDFDLWNASDFLPEEDPNDGELLLDELEQDDILTELLHNARTYLPSTWS
jgi:hypothetical protein